MSERPSESSVAWAMARWSNGIFEHMHSFGVGQLAQALDIIVRELKAQYEIKVKYGEVLAQDWKDKAYAASSENATLRREATVFYDWRERILTAALRYESRHDRDPERVQLWRELKTAICVEPHVEST